MCSTHSSRKNDSGRNNFNLEGTYHIMAVLSRYKVLTTTVHLRRFYHTRTSGDNNCKQSQRKMWTSGYRTPGDRASFMNLLFFLYYVWAFHLQITSSYVSFFNFKSFMPNYRAKKTKVILKYGLHLTCWHIWVRAYFPCSNSSSSCSENMFVLPFCNCRTSLTSWWPSRRSSPELAHLRPSLPFVRERRKTTEKS